MTRAARVAIAGNILARCTPSLSIRTPASQPPTAIPKIIAVTTMFIPSFNNLAGSICYVRTCPAIEVGAIMSPATNSASISTIRFVANANGMSAKTNSPRQRIQSTPAESLNVRAPYQNPASMLLNANVAIKRPASGREFETSACATTITSTAPALTPMHRIAAKITSNPGTTNADDCFSCTALTAGSVPRCAASTTARRPRKTEDKTQARQEDERPCLAPWQE